MYEQSRDISRFWLPRHQSPCDLGGLEMSRSISDRAAHPPRSVVDSGPPALASKLTTPRRGVTPMRRPLFITRAALILILAASPVWGGTTGKLAGRVVDEK